MKKKVLAATLASALTVSLLAGCGSSSSGSSSTPAASTGAASTTAAASVDSAAAADAGAAAIQARKDSGANTKLVMAFMNWSGSPAGVSRVSEALSAITAEKLGVEVELMIMDSASYNQQMTLMLSSGEQVDIYSSCILGYNSVVNKGYALNLEEDNLIQTYGQGIIDEMSQEYIDATRISGVLYGTPQQKDNAVGLEMVVIDKEALDGIGFDYTSIDTDDDPEAVHTDWATIDDIFAQLHAAYPDKHVVVPSTLLAQALYHDNLGDDYGGLMDPENSLEVTNVFASDGFRELCERAYKWNQAGYVSADALTDDTAAPSLVKAGSLLAYQTGGKPGIKAQESGLCGKEMIAFQCGPNFTRANSIASMPWCINSGTADPVAAMQFLNECYTNPEVSDLLCWGEEGKDYVKTDDGHYTFPDGVDAQTSEFYNNVTWEMPNQFIAGIWVGNDLDIWDRMKTFNSTSVTSKALGFAFDNSAVSTEYTAISNVSDQYLKSLCMGFTDPATGIDEFNAALKTAGLDEYIAAKQAALDEWAAAAGIQ